MTKFRDLFRTPEPLSASAGVEQAATADWTPRRAPVRQQELVLSAGAERWLDGMLPELRPVRLAALYPRVANRLALCWSDPELTHLLFDDLLGNRRGTRKGFPVPVADELRRLRRLLPQRRTGLSSDATWDLGSLAVGDR